MGQDFLLAAMIICLDFDHLKTRSQDGPLVSKVRSEENILRALQTSYSICSESAASSTAALNVLKMIFEKVTPTVNDKVSEDLMKSTTDPTAWLTPVLGSTYASTWLFCTHGLHFNRQRIDVSRECFQASNWTDTSVPGRWLL